MWIGKLIIGLIIYQIVAKVLTRFMEYVVYMNTKELPRKKRMSFLDYCIEASIHRW